MSKKDRIALKEELLQEAVIKKRVGKPPDVFEAVILSGDDTGTHNQYEGTAYGNPKRNNSQEPSYIFTRVRRQDTDELEKPDPFLATDRNMARKLVNLHPVAVLLVTPSTLQRPRTGEIWSCRYLSTDRRGIILINRVGVSKKFLALQNKDSLYQSQASSWSADSPQLASSYSPPSQNNTPSNSSSEQYKKVNEVVNNSQTHWNFDASKSPPSDWNIVNFTTEDLKSKGNNMVVQNKFALRALDKAASQAAQMGHPKIILTNMARSNRNGAYRDPTFNASVGGATHSRHTYGDAYDIWTKDWTKEQRLSLLRNLHSVGFRGFGHGWSNIHADTSRKRQWGYSGYPVPSYSSFDGSR